MWFLKGALRRRPVALVGAACTSVIVGFAIFNRVLTTGGQAQCIATCATTAAYQILQKNEASRKVKQHRVEGFDVNFLGSNSPIEDRFVIGASHNLGSAFFSIIDGHKGFRCSHYLQNNMLQYLSTALHKAGNVLEKSDLKVLLDMTRLNSYPLDSSEIQPTEGINQNVITECLRESLVALDDKISNTALEDVKLLHKGHSLTPDMKERVLTAIEGACAITTLVRQKDVFVASTGDCRAVIGQLMPDKTWKAVQLSDDQNAQNEAEVKRLQEAHPGEQVIFGNRVLGSLMPFRTFGDVDFKWEKKYLKGLVNMWMNYETPPYVTAEPVITHRAFQKGDRFMIIGSDGLWERISNEEAVKVVAQTIDNGTQKSGFRSIFGSSKTSGKDCCEQNAATKLLWHVLGGTEFEVTELLNADPQFRRMLRDDITIIVVYFSDHD